MCKEMCSVLATQVCLCRNNILVREPMKVLPGLTFVNKESTETLSRLTLTVQEPKDVLHSLNTVTDSLEPHPGLSISGIVEFISKWINGNNVQPVHQSGEVFPGTWNQDMRLTTC